MKAGLAIDEHFLLPLGQHPWHRNHTQSYCVAVTLADGRRLLVPCVELIRFYFGSSSNLLQRLFTGPLRPEMLWTSKRADTENRHLHLVLANRLSGTSAADIGRIAESGLAWRAAAGIHASCQKATAQRHPAYPYTGFPFEGTTDLVASGIWLPFGEVVRFLANDVSFATIENRRAIVEGQRRQRGRAHGTLHIAESIASSRCRSAPIRW